MKNNTVANCLVNQKEWTITKHYRGFSTPTLNKITYIEEYNYIE